MGPWKYSEWREVKLIDNDYICKILVSHIWSGAFLANFGHISQNVFLFLLLILNIELNWIKLNWIEIIYFQIKSQRVYNQNISIYNTSKYIKVYTIYSLG